MEDGDNKRDGKKNERSGFFSGRGSRVLKALKDRTSINDMIRARVTEASKAMKAGKRNLAAKGNNLFSKIIADAMAKKISSSKKHQPIIKTLTAENIKKIEKVDMNIDSVLEKTTKLNAGDV